MECGVVARRRVHSADVPTTGTREEKLLLEQLSAAAIAGAGSRWQRFIRIDTTALQRSSWQE